MRPETERVLESIPKEETSRMLETTGQFVIELIFEVLIHFIGFLIEGLLS